MSPRPLGLMLAAALVAGCGAADDATRAIDDIARMSGSTSDEIDVLAQRSVGGSDAAADDLLVQWQQRLAAGRSAYQDVPTEARSVACDVATDALEAILSAEGGFSVLVSGAEAVASLNQTVGADQLASDLQVALDDWKAGDDSPLVWLVLKSSTCAVAS